MNKIRKIIVWPFLLIIRLYQIVISPWLGPRCRFAPSCSNYAIDALKTHGLFKGGFYAVRRIIRCHPWGGGGYDPVPPKDISSALCCQQKFYTKGTVSHKKNRVEK